MSRPRTHDDAEILAICRELASQGIDPTYRSVRRAGAKVCGDRLVRLRDHWVASGELELPANSKLRSQVVIGILSQRRPEPIKRVPWVIPETPRQFLRAEHRLLRCRCHKCSPRILVRGGVFQLVMWFADHTVSRKKGTR